MINFSTLKGLRIPVLPNGYTKLEYIETTGTQYIDTGVILNQDSRIVCEYMYKGGSGVYGARNTVQTRNFSMRVINGAWQFGYGDGVTTSAITADTTEWHIADQNKNVLYIDGNLAAQREYVTFTTPQTMAIGAIKAGSIYYGKGCYRACQIYDNGVLVRNLIPCKDANGNIGMYDILNTKFYGNAGTGEFVAGAEVGTSDGLCAVAQIADASGRVLWSASKTVNTMYLRPSADISVEHSLYPADSASAYMLVNEEVNDNAATYIYSTHTDSNFATNATASFALYPSKPIKSNGVTSAKTVFDYVYSSGVSTPQLFYSLTVDGETFDLYGDLVETASSKKEFLLNSNILEFINSYISQNGTIPPITILVETRGTRTSSKENGTIGVGQIYLELTGEFVV